MRPTEFFRKQDVLSQESPLFEIPRRKEILLREIGRGKKVLDLGCLGGQVSRLIQDQNNDVYGVEINEKAAAAAQARGVKVKVFDLNDGIPFEDDKFDVVHAGEVLEKLFDSLFLFQEAHRVLKVGGQFLFSVPNLNSLTNRWKVLKGEYLGNLGAYPEDHFGERIRVFNLDKIREICANSGFRIEAVFGVDRGLGHEGSVARTLTSTVFPRLWPQFFDLLVIRAKKTLDS